MRKLQTGNIIKMEKKLDLAGVRIDDYSVREAIRKVEDFFDSECMNTVENITMKTLVAADRDDSVRECLEKTDLVMAADKEILELAGIVLPDRIREVEEKEFFYEFMKSAVRNHQTLFLLSQTELEMKRLAEFLEELYGEEIQICGQYVFDNCQGDEADIVNEINGVSPGIILSILPTPEQERFLYHHQGMFNASIWYGVSKECDITESNRGLKSWLKKKRYGYQLRQKVHSQDTSSQE